MTDRRPTVAPGSGVRNPHGPSGASPNPLWRSLLPLVLVFAGMTWWQHSQASMAPSHEVSYSQFYQWAAAGKVAKVTLQGQAISGQLGAAEKLAGQQLKRFTTTLPAQRDEALLRLLRDKGVEIVVREDKPSLVAQALGWLLPWLVLIAIGVWVSRRARKMGGSAGPLGAGMGGWLKQRTPSFERQSEVSVRFDDVAGLGSAKRDLQEVVGFLKEPERYRRLGAKVPRGVLLVGPPGTGKTLLARAVAGEAGVPFFSIDGSAFIELFVGMGASRVRGLFEEAKKVSPSIVFIDEIDAVGRARGAGLGGGHDEREQTLNQLLSEMDGFTRNDLTIVLAASNRPDVLDPALLRPGRFDRRVVTDRPELEARRAILEVHSQGSPLENSVSLLEVARNTPGFSGADLANLVNEAALNATRRAADAIAKQDFATAFDKIVLGDPRDSKLSAGERRRIAVHESGHAIVAHFSPHSEPLHRVSIIPRGMTLGATQQQPAADRHVITQPELEAQLRVLMGGHTAEGIVLGSVSSGAENDLKLGSELAARMVAHYGMSEALGPVYHEHRSEHPFLGQTLAAQGGTGDATVHLIEEETRKVLTGAREEARRLLERHREPFDALAAALLERETVERPTLDALLGHAETSADAVPPAGVHALN